MVDMFSSWNTGGFETVGTAPSCGSLWDGCGLGAAARDSPTHRAFGKRSNRNIRAINIGWLVVAIICG